jgi:hypothetical protein
MKKILFSVLLFMAMGWAQQQQQVVKSQQGAVNVYRLEQGDDVLCSAPFNENLPVLRKSANRTFVRARCGQGWVDNGAVEIVVAAQDRSVQIDDVDIAAWTENPAAVFVLEADASEYENPAITRDFKDYLRHTVDRETVERANQDN